MMKKHVGRILLLKNFFDQMPVDFKSFFAHD